MSAAVITADGLAGTTIRFPILLLLPVGLAAWYEGRGAGLALALCLPAVRWAALEMGHTVPDGPTWLNAIIQGIVLAVVAGLVDQASQRQRLSSEVRVLRGLLPVCAWCKKIRNERGEWEPMEVYVQQRSEADFTHGICEACASKVAGQSRPPPSGSAH